MKVARAVVIALWPTVLLAHAVAAIGVWRLLPGGFPASHAHFFANRLLPALVVLSVLAVAVRVLRRARGASVWLLVYPSAWFGVALAALVFFPQSGRRVALAAVIVALLLALSLFAIWRQPEPQIRGVRLALVFGAALGAALVFAQRAPEPSTHPFATALAADPGNERKWSAFDAREVTSVTPWLRVGPSSDRLTVQAGAVAIVVKPRLDFISRSPDRFWTVFAPAQATTPTVIVRAERSEQELRLEDADGGSLRVQASARSALLEARTLLEAPVYSHLNAFSELSVTGHRRLGLRFSPCPGTLVEVSYSEYPTGAPARLAYLDARGMFRVVQASDAEKGPFTTLAAGSLTRDQPLAIALIELSDSAQPELATVVFRDWPRQLSTDLSPTAGWGLPQNAIEFGRASPDPASAVHINLTLAGTSVGRGWDSVGHGAGVYTNRMEIFVTLPPE